jgi:Cdc6-like AAA superfamily ATPase
VALAEKQHRRLKATELTPVKIEHVKQVMDRSLGSPIVAVIKGLPMHQKFALCGTILANRVNKNSKMSDVWDQYSSLLRSNNLKGVLTTEFYEMYKDLMSYSLIAIEGKNKDERMKTVRLTVNENDVVFALKEDTFLGEALGTSGDVNA